MFVLFPGTIDYFRETPSESPVRVKLDLSKISERQALHGIYKALHGNVAASQFFHQESQLTLIHTKIPLSFLADPEWYFVMRD
jgi:hypothetical protein